MTADSHGGVTGPAAPRRETHPSSASASAQHGLAGFARSPGARIGIGILVVFLVAAVFAPLIAHHDPGSIRPRERLRPPSGDHWLGTDDLGRDVFSRVLHGGRLSLLVCVTVVLAAGMIGTLVGAVAGFSSRFDRIAMRIVDALMAFPGILLAIVVAVALGPQLWTVVVALTLVYVPAFARLVRSATLVVREQPFVESARALGLPAHRVLSRHVVGHLASPISVQATFTAGAAVLAEASLAFLGASGDPTVPSWGNMLSDGQRLVATAWWLAVPPGVSLFLVVLACTLVGDALSDAADPRASDPHLLNRRLRSGVRRRR